MAFGGRLFVDTALPFGLRSAPKLFTAVADALKWILRKNGATWLEHYIDDFLTMGNPRSEECAKNLALIKSWCSWLGLPLKEEKEVGPTTVLEFLGIILDTDRMEIRLSEERVQQLMALLEDWSEESVSQT